VADANHGLKMAAMGVAISLALAYLLRSSRQPAIQRKSRRPVALHYE
jgi:hypothetical protein